MIDFDDIWFKCLKHSRQKVNKNKLSQKWKHTNSILEYFEYFCQMSSKSILIILSCTVSKLVHFLWQLVVHWLNVRKCRLRLFQTGLLTNAKN